MLATSISKCAATLEGLAGTSGFAFGDVFADNALVSLQLPVSIRAVGEPLSNANLPVDLASSHGDARLLTGGYDLLQAELAIAENSHDKHGDLHW
jgi:hypothetical protein